VAISPQSSSASYRPAPTGTDPATLDGNDRVDINAGGALSSGVITPADVEDPSRGLVNYQPSQLIPSSTSLYSGRSQGQTICITGRGGLPPSPNEALDSEAIQVDGLLTLG